MPMQPAVPKPHWWETAIAIGLDNFVPGASQVAGSFIPNSFQKRQFAFLEQLASDILEHGIDIQGLQERVEYLSFVHRVARHGVETADEVKLEALLRAARKALVDVPPDKWQVRDLHLAKLVALTSLHLHLARFLASPSTYGVTDEQYRAAKSSANRIKTIVDALPQLKGQEMLVKTLLDDLVGVGILEGPEPVSGPGSGLQLTPFGQAFADFVWKED